MTWELPWPPSVNTYWRMFRGRMCISQAGKDYRASVQACVWNGRGFPKKIKGRVRLQIEASPPDHRRRDLDNTLKAVCDSLEAAGVYEDDSQIDHLEIKRGSVVPDGELLVIVTEL